MLFRSPIRNENISHCRTGEIVTSTDDEEDYYVIIKGRQPSDTGIYGTWSETAPKVQDGVSAPIHKKCTGSKEAKKYLAMGGIPDAEINQHMEKVKEIKKTRTRKLRKKSRVNYRHMSGGKNTKNAEKDNDDTLTKERISDEAEAEKKREGLEKELQKARADLQENQIREHEDNNTIRALTTENEALKEEIKEDKKAIEILTKRNTALEAALRAERADKRTSPKPTVTVITDSNGRTVTKHLRRLMGEHEIKEVTGIYHTTDLLAKIKKDKKPTTQNTIILMGTNNVRTGNAERANRNIQELAKLLDAEKTIVAHIPPMEIGHQGSDQYEDRGIFNRMITTAFPNHVRMNDLVKEQKRDRSILADDGYHLTEKGGEWAANKITKQLITNTDKTNTDKHRKEAVPTKDNTKPVNHRQRAAPSTPPQTTPHPDHRHHNRHTSAHPHQPAQKLIS